MQAWSFQRVNEYGNFNKYIKRYTVQWVNCIITYYDGKVKGYWFQCIQSLEYKVMQKGIAK